MNLGGPKVVPFENHHSKVNILSWKLKIGGVRAETHTKKKKQTLGGGFFIFTVFQLDSGLGELPK